MSLQFVYWGILVARLMDQCIDTEMDGSMVGCINMVCP